MNRRRVTALAGRVAAAAGLIAIGAGHAAGIATTAGLPERYALAGVWQPNDTDASLDHPEGVDVGTDGRLVVAEAGSHRVSVWSADNAPSARWGRHGAAPGQFDSPEDVALDDARARVYVADTGNRRVQVIDRATGATFAIWDDVGRPRGIAVGPDGAVYISDADADRILVRGPDGERRSTWGGTGDAPGRFDTPLGLSVGPDGRLYVADSGNQRVQWLAADGSPGGALALDNADHPGGVPTDVGVTAAGELYVAVERGILRFRGGSGFAGALQPFREVDDPDCAVPGRCKRQITIAENHEGVRRLAVAPDGTVTFTYAPAMRSGDAAYVFSPRWAPRIAGHRAAGPHLRRLYDPARIDAGADPFAANVLDTSGLARTLRSAGQWYDGMRAFATGRGTDVAADVRMPQLTGVVTGNQVRVQSLQCFLGCSPAELDVLEPSRLTRVDRVGDRVPDVTWWYTALAMRETIAVLDTGRQQVVVRDGFACDPSESDPERGPYPCDPPSPCKRSAPSCPRNPVARRLVSAMALNGARDPFRAFRDVAYDASGALWVLARDGGLLSFDARGRRQAEVKLAGLRSRTAEALALGPNAQTFVLTDDGWIVKSDGAGRPLAAWAIADQAGPGRYRDLALDDAGRVIVPDGDHDRLLVFAPIAGPDAQTPQPPRDERCSLSPRKRADPTRLTLGQTTAISLSLGVDCPSARVDVALVVDLSCQASGERLAAARAAGAAFVGAMTRAEDHIAVIGFSDLLGGARLLAPLSPDRAEAAATVLGLAPDCQPPMFYPDRRGDGRISDGMRAGREELQGIRGRDDAGKVLVLVSPSIMDRELVERQIWGRWIAGARAPEVSERDHATWEGWRLWEAGVRVFAVGAGEGSRPIGPNPEPTPDLQSTHPPDRGLLASLARPADAFRNAEAPSDLAAVLRGIGSELSSRTMLQEVEVVDRLPANMRLVPGSVSPPPDAMSDGTIRWTFRDVPPGEAPTLSMQVEPLEGGRWPTNTEAIATYRTNAGYVGAVAFPVPEVDVLAPAPTATPSASATAARTPSAAATATVTAASTATAIASATVTPAQTAVPTRTPQPVPARRFLPLTLVERCVPKQQPVDVALVLDTSSSMSGAKLEAAVAASETFLGLMGLPRDHAAIVSFDSEARVLVPLTGDEAALRRALASMATSLGTRIDLGLEAGLQALVAPERRTAADAVLVLLTDGLPQGDSGPDTLLAGDAVRARGIVVYAVGLGTDVDPALLEALAGDRRRMYLAPTEADLARIYAEIARMIPCR